MIINHVMLPRGIFRVVTCSPQISSLRLSMSKRGYYRGGRGGRGENRRHYNEGGEGESARRGGGPPRGLRGRDIGLYYAKKSQAKKEAREKHEV